MCKPVHHEVEFDATPKQVYEAYLDSRRQGRITGIPAKMSRKEGGRFSSGDYITGYNLLLEPGRKIVQAWRGSDWPRGAYSVLTLEMKPRGKRTRLVVDQLGIPEKHRDEVDSGWYQYFWDPMQRYFSGERSGGD